MAAVQPVNKWPIVETLKHNAQNLFSREDNVEIPRLTKEEFKDLLERIMDDLSSTRTNIDDASTDIRNFEAVDEIRDETLTRLQRMGNVVDQFNLWAGHIELNLRMGGLRQWLQRNAYKGQGVTKGDLVNKADRTSTDFREIVLDDLFECLDNLEMVLNDLWIAMDNAARRLASRESSIMKT